MNEKTTVKSRFKIAEFLIASLLGCARKLVEKMKIRGYKVLCARASKKRSFSIYKQLITLPAEKLIHELLALIAMEILFYKMAF